MCSNMYEHMYEHMHECNTNSNTIYIYNPASNTYDGSSINFMWILYSS